jgi:hypothetical protein
VRIINFDIRVGWGFSVFTGPAETDFVFDFRGLAGTLLGLRLSMWEPPVIERTALITASVMVN